MTAPAQPTSDLGATPAGLRLPWLILIVFASSMCMMVLELVAGRIIAPYVGVSLGGLFSVCILLIEKMGVSLPDAWPIVLRILVLTAALFFLPSVLLGMVSPVVAKLAVHDLAKTGSTVGRISAAATLGSIVGTFVTGFVLISLFGTRLIVWGVAVVLFAMAAILLLGRSRKGLLPLVILAGVILDRLVHSYSSLDDPTQLVYGYEQVYAEATAYQALHHDPLRALFIGGGGYTFPRYMEAVYPDSKLDVIEIDPGVTEVAYDLLGLRHDSPITTYNEDARMFLAKQPDTKYDLIMGDAFNDYSVPYHLTTLEFNERAKAWLSDGGLYMVNLIDGPRRDFLRAYINTLGHTFSHVYVVPAVRSWRESPRVTFVLIATDTPLDPAAFKKIDAGDGETFFAEQVLDAAAVDALLAEGPAIVLTDDYAPVDQMLAPVARGEEVRPGNPKTGQGSSVSKPSLPTTAPQ